MAGVVGVLLLVFLWPRAEDRQETVQSEPSPTEVASSEPGDPPTPEIEPVVEDDPAKPNDDEPPQGVADIPGEQVAVVVPVDEPPMIDVPLPAPREVAVQPVGFQGEDTPIEPQFAPEFTDERPMQIDVRQSLDIRIVKFDQSRPIALREMLQWFEEYLGVPIRSEDERIPPMRLDRTVTVSLENTTFGEVLTSITQQAGLSYEIRDTEIVLTPIQE